MEERHGRLDMRHGFVKSIIKNQEDRDNYDKVVKERQKSKKSTTVRGQTGRTKRKPDLSTYVPPSVRSNQQDERTGEDASAVDDLVFVLEFEDDDGQISRLPVHKSDRALRLAQQFSKRKQFTAEMVEALAIFLDQQRLHMLDSFNSISANISALYSTATKQQAVTAAANSTFTNITETYATKADYVAIKSNTSNATISASTNANANLDSAVANSTATSSADTANSNVNVVDCTSTVYKAPQAYNDYQSNDDSYTDDDDV